MSLRQLCSSLKPHLMLSPLNQNKPAQIIMVASGKGGVGKTWFSISLVQALAKQGKRVLLFDGDLGLANVDIQLGLLPDKDLSMVFNGKAELADVITCYEEGRFDIIAGRSGCGQLSGVKPERLLYVQKSLKKLAQHYDYIIMDLGAGIGHTVRSLSTIADECYVVMTDEPTSMTDAYAFIKLTHQQKLPLLLKIVMNQVDTWEAGQQTYRTMKNVCENFLNFTPPLLGIIHRDKAVREAIRQQKPVLLHQPLSMAARDVKKLIHTMV